MKPARIHCRMVTHAEVNTSRLNEKFTNDQKGLKPEEQVATEAGRNGWPINIEAAAPAVEAM